MARASSSSASRFTSGLASQGAALVGKLKQTDGLTWAVLAAIVLYVAVASPANTPTIFRNTLFRFVVFAFAVVVFLVEGPVIGTMFALAMLLPIVYSSMGATQEGFEDTVAMPTMASISDEIPLDTEAEAEALEEEADASEVRPSETVLGAEAFAFTA
jgi:hypothetical protein